MQHGVKVLWAYNPWDTGTWQSRGLNTGEPGHATVLMNFVQLLKRTHADGINGDTVRALDLVRASVQCLPANDGNGPPQMRFVP